MLGEYNIIVCGGGPAGCAAALAAARHGTRTLLIEKDGYLGGATVSQLVVPILSTNGVDFQGVWHEFMRALKRRNGVAELTRQRRHSAHWVVGSVDPEMAKYAWDDLLAEAGVELLHLAFVAGVIVEQSVMRGILVETRASRRALYAKRVIDATGDGIVCAEAGVPWEQGAHGQPWAMGVGFMGAVGNVPEVRQTVPGQAVPGFGRALGPRPECLLGLQRILHVDPLNPWDLTRALHEGRTQAWERLEAKRCEPGHEAIYLAATPAQPGVRSSRRIHGIATVTASDAWRFHKYADGVARSSWEIDIHSPEDPTAEAVPFTEESYMTRIGRMKQGDYFDIRYGCLVAEGVDNLLVAGRCISAEHEAQASLRIQQTCMATGQAAGTAAALSLQEGVTPRELDATKVVAQLERDRDVEPAFEILKGLPLASRQL